ncbi:MAG: hypothetical protein JNK15_16445, partial [Planctomycetes bacterium]|nr:hypothetical protein [Planctomycetota bacterium]
RIKLEEQRRELKASDPALTKTQQQIDDIDGVIRQLSDAAKNLKPQRISVKNKAYELRKEEREKTALELETAQTTLRHAKEQHEKKVASLRALQGLESEFTSLRADRQTAETTEAASRITWEVWQQKRALGQGNFSSLREFGKASLPLEKEGPDRGKLLLGGFFVGLFFGLGIVVLRALPDRVVRTREDLESIDGLAVIGSMPRLDNTNLRRHVALREQGW